MNLNGRVLPYSGKMLDSSVPVWFTPDGNHLISFASFENPKTLAVLVDGLARGENGGGRLPWNNKISLEEKSANRWFFLSLPTYGVKRQFVRVNVELPLAN